MLPQRKEEKERGFRKTGTKKEGDNRIGKKYYGEDLLYRRRIPSLAGKTSRGLATEDGESCGGKRVGASSSTGRGASGRRGRRGGSGFSEDFGDGGSGMVHGQMVIKPPEKKRNKRQARMPASRRGKGG